MSQNSNKNPAKSGKLFNVSLCISFLMKLISTQDDRETHSLDTSFFLP